MDVAKFLSLLETSCMFFPSTSTLRNTDPFEGQLPIANRKKRQEMYEAHFVDHPEDRDKLDVEELWRFVRQINESLVDKVLVNCWHVADNESDAMWKLYGSTIAICTSVGSLIDSIQAIEAFDIERKPVDVPIYIGTIEYIDHEQHFIPETDWLKATMSKRKSFDHERELRAVIQLLPGHFGSEQLFRFEQNDEIPEIFERVKENGGLNVPVDLEVLIEGIVVSPTMPKWFSELIKSLIERYGLDIPIYGDEEEFRKLPPLDFKMPRLSED